MGQKVNPISFRLPITKNWSSSWFKSKLEYAGNVIDDLKIHRFFKPLTKAYNIKSIKIDRVVGKVIITVFTAKPGIFIKKAEDGIENLIKKLSIVLGYKVSINVMDVKNPSLSAQLVGIFIATQIEKRASYVRVIKKAIADVMKAGASGVKVKVSGRLSGAEIARTEKYGEGTVPLQELRANVDYALVEANTVYGVIGIKVWINTHKN
jgi:small subunit ribosomal protein S3